MACRTSSGSVVARALEKPPPAPPKSLVLGAKSLLAALSGPNSTRQRGAACTNTGSMNAASIIADVYRPLAMSHAKTPSASATSAHRPELMIARGSALRIQPPILTADTNKESASVAYATTVKSMAHHPLGPSVHLARGFPSAPPRRSVLFSQDASRTRVRLFLDRARHRRDVVLDEEGVEDDQRQRADQRPRHERAPPVDVAVDEFVDDRDRDRLVLGRGNEGERVDEFVPAQREAENEGRDQARHRQRQDDLGEDLVAAGAVDERAFLELEWNRLEIAHQQPGRERDQYGGIGEDQRERCVEQAVLEHDGRQRNEQDRRRNEVGEEDRAADPLSTPVAQPHDRIGREHAGDDREDGRGDRD